MAPNILERIIISFIFNWLINESTQVVLFQVVHSKYISIVTVALVGEMEQALEWLVSTFTSETPSNSAWDASAIKFNHLAMEKIHPIFIS